MEESAFSWAESSGISYNKQGRPFLPLGKENNMAKRLFRSANQKMLGGVCAGLAEYLDIDVSIVRLLWVGLALVTAVLPMTFFYIIAWIVIPMAVPNSQA